MPPFDKTALYLGRQTQTQPPVAAVFNETQGMLDASPAPLDSFSYIASNLPQDPPRTLDDSQHKIEVKGFVDQHPILATLLGRHEKVAHYYMREVGRLKNEIRRLDGQKAERTTISQQDEIKKKTEEVYRAMVEALEKASAAFVKAGLFENAFLTMWEAADILFVKLNEKDNAKVKFGTTSGVITKWASSEKDPKRAKKLNVVAAGLFEAETRRVEDRNIEALDKYEEIKKILLELDCKKSAEIIKNSQDGIVTKLKKRTIAMIDIFGERALPERVGYLLDTARFYDNIGKNYDSVSAFEFEADVLMLVVGEMGQFPESRRKCVEALGSAAELYQRVGQEKKAIDALFMLGDMLVELGEEDTAFANYVSALRVAGALRKGVSKSEDIGLAGKYFWHQTTDLVEKDDFNNVMKNARRAVFFYWRDRQFGNAVGIYEQLFEFYKKKGSLERLASVGRALAQLYKKKENYNKAAIVYIDMAAFSEQHNNKFTDTYLNEAAKITFTLARSANVKVTTANAKSIVNTWLTVVDLCEKMEGVRKSPHTERLMVIAMVRAFHFWNALVKAEGKGTRGGDPIQKGLFERASRVVENGQALLKEAVLRMPELDGLSRSDAEQVLVEIVYIWGQKLTSNDRNQIMLSAEGGPKILGIPIAWLKKATKLVIERRGMGGFVEFFKEPGTYELPRVEDLRFKFELPTVEK